MAEKRFRATLFIDVWVEDIGKPIEEKIRATNIAEEFASLRPNAYVGAVDPWGTWAEKLLGVRQ